MDDFLGKLPRRSSLQGEASVRVLLNCGTVKMTAGELTDFLIFYSSLIFFSCGLWV